MSIVSVEICDRCKCEINSTVLPFVRIKSIHRITRILGCGPYDYGSSEITLCKECTKKLDNFMKGGD